MIKWHPGTQVVPTGTRYHWQYPAPRYPPPKGVPVPDRLWTHQKTDTEVPLPDGEEMTAATRAMTDDRFRKSTFWRVAADARMRVICRRPPTIRKGT
jgi:hypothetical protein